MNLKIYDNFLKKDDFEILENINFSSTRSQELRIYRSTISKNLNCSSEILPEKIVKSSMKIIKKSVGHIKRIMS